MDTDLQRWLSFVASSEAQQQEMLKAAHEAHLARLAQTPRPTLGLVTAFVLMLLAAFIILG